MGKYIGGLTLAGGVFVIWSLMSPQVNGARMFVGIVIFLAAIILFLRELSRIAKKKNNL